jgi:hypothetical protein
MSLAQAPKLPDFHRILLPAAACVQVLPRHGVMPDEDVYYYRILLRMSLDPEPGWWAKFDREAAACRARCVSDKRERPFRERPVVCQRGTPFMMSAWCGMAGMKWGLTLLSTVAACAGAAHLPSSLAGPGASTPPLTLKPAQASTGNGGGSSMSAHPQGHCSEQALRSGRPGWRTNRQILGCHGGLRRTALRFGATAATCLAGVDKGSALRQQREQAAVAQAQRATGPGPEAAQRSSSRRQAAGACPQ